MQKKSRRRPNLLFQTFLIPYRFRLQSSVPLPIDGLPSILMLLERNVMGNILFRVAAVIPIIVRVFQSNCIRLRWNLKSVITEFWRKKLSRLNLQSIRCVHTIWKGCVYNTIWHSVVKSIVIQIWHFDMTWHYDTIRYDISVVKSIVSRAVRNLVSRCSYDCGSQIIV